MVAIREVFTMYFQYTTQNLILKVLDEECKAKVLRFYLEGDSFFGRLEPDRPEGFFSEDYQGKLLKYEMKGFLDGAMVRYYAFEKNNPDRIIGTISLRDIKRGAFCSATIGYKLLPDYTGRGFATEMVRAVTYSAFKEEALHRINAYVQPDNPASVKVLEKVGYEKEGLARRMIKLNGQWKDHLLYACVNYSD